MLRRLIAILGFVGLVACGDEPRRPWNLVVVTLDTTRSDTLSPYGGDPRATPNLQRFAERSTLFRNAFSETNITNPSHLTIFSGLGASEHGVLGNASPVPPEVDTLPEALRRAGYATAGFPAVRHLGRQMAWRGFDHLGTAQSPQPAAAISTAAADWIRANAEKPFFAWVHYYDPHATYVPPADIAQRFDSGDPRAGDGPLVTDHEYFRVGARRIASIREVSAWLEGVRDPGYPAAMYRAEVHYVDRELARVLAALDEAGVAKRTVVVVVADHGESLGEHGIFFSHRGVYEQQLRIPLLVHVPGLAPGEIDDLVTTRDVAPTLCDLLGVEIERVGSGRSLLPLIEDPSAAFVERDFVVHQNANNHVVAVRRGGWKLVWPVTKGHWLLSGEPELYHLTDDPFEESDLAAREPELVAELRALGDPWIALGTAPALDAVQLDEEALESLRNLGYLED